MKPLSFCHEDKKTPKIPLTLQNIDVFSESFPGGAKKVRDSLSVLKEAIEKYDDGLSVSFNGGKDASVILHLSVLACSLYYPSSSSSSSSSSSPSLPLDVLYHREDECFEEMDKFVFEEAKSLSLKITLEEDKNMKEGVLSFVSKTNSKAIILGTRTGDPHSSSLSSFSPCDPSWGGIMRVSPILEWTYKDVWDFLRFFDVPYCCMYDKGFTSVGNRNNTIPNPLLKKEEEEEEEKKEKKEKGEYWPAYMLKDWSQERGGRSPKR